MDWHPRGNRLRVESRRYARYINVTNSVKRTMLRTEKVGKVERKRRGGRFYVPTSRRELPSLNTCGDLSYICRKGGYIDGRVEREGERAPRSRSFANMAVI